MVLGLVLEPARRHPQPLLDDGGLAEIQPHRAAVAVNDGSAAFLAYHGCSSNRSAG
jgi:hypothetical protein